MRRWSVTIAVAVMSAVAGCSDDGGSVEAFCATAREFATDNPALVFDRYDPADPAGAAVLLREAGDRLEAWAQQAPGEVDGDVETIADAAFALAEAFESPGATGAGDLEEQFSDVEQASGRVTAFSREQCGVELDAPTG